MSSRVAGAALAATLWFPTPARAQAVLFDLFTNPERGLQFVEFEPALGDRVSIRGRAEATNVDVASLEAQGYVRIGTVVAQLVPKPSGEDPTPSAVLREAGQHGGDLVTFTELGFFGPLTVEVRKCAKWAPVLAGATSVPVCVSWEYVPVTSDVFRSAGEVWRHDPDLAERTRAAGVVLSALKTDDSDVVRAYLAEGGNPDEAGGTSLLRAAATHGATASLQVLLEAGAKHIEAPNDFGERPLWLACQAGSTESARVLLDWGAKLDRTSNDGRSALHVAAESGNPDVVALLLERGAKAHVLDSAGPLVRKLIRSSSPYAARMNGLRAGSPSPSPSRNSPCSSASSSAISASMDPHIAIETWSSTGSVISLSAAYSGSSQASSDRLYSVISGASDSSWMPDSVSMSSSVRPRVRSGSPSSRWVTQRSLMSTSRPFLFSRRQRSCRFSRMP